MIRVVPFAKRWHPFLFVFLNKAQYTNIFSPENFSWQTGEWEKCSAVCGDGIQFRNVYCQQVQYGGVYSIVAENECIKNGSSKPKNTRPCENDRTCPEWVAGQWSVVS